MKEWFIYQADGNHVGPVTSETLARGIAGGKVPRDAHVGCVGDPAWVQVINVPEVVQALRALEGQAAAPGARPPMSSVAPTPPPPPHSSPSVQEVARAAAALSAAAPKPEAQAAAAAPAAATAPKPEEKKPEEKKAPPLPAIYNKVPAIIFGSFFAVAIALVVVAMIVKPGTTDVERALNAIQAAPAASAAAK